VMFYCYASRETNWMEIEEKENKCMQVSWNMWK